MYLATSPCWGLACTVDYKAGVLLVHMGGVPHALPLELGQWIPAQSNLIWILFLNILPGKSTAWAVFW